MHNVRNVLVDHQIDEVVAERTCILLLVEVLEDLRSLLAHVTKQLCYVWALVSDTLELTPGRVAHLAPARLAFDLDFAD